MDEKGAFILSQEREPGEKKKGEKEKDGKKSEKEKEKEKDEKGNDSSGRTERKKSMVSSLNRTSGLKMCSSEPSLLEGEDERRHELDDVILRNPYTSRFTSKQIEILIKSLKGFEKGKEDVNENERVGTTLFIGSEKKKKISKEEIEKLKKELGTKGAGGILLSTHILMNWFNYE